MTPPSRPRRTDGRRADGLRPLAITPGAVPSAEGSALIRLGETRVLSAASVEDRVPRLARRAGARLGDGRIRHAAPGDAAAYRPRSRHRQAVTAVSVGVVRGTPRLDIDCNVVMTDGGAFVELQGTAEKEPFDRRSLDSLLDLAGSGIGALFAAQAAAIGADGSTPSSSAP